MNDEELERRVREASAASAGVPGAATRAAILRAAAAEAARRAGTPVPPGTVPSGAQVVPLQPGATPAKRATYWPWQAAAALAMLGVGAWLWLQLRPGPLPETAPVVADAGSDAAELLAESVVAEAPAMRAEAAREPEAPEFSAYSRLSSVASAPAPAVNVSPALLAELARRFPEAWQSDAPVPGLWVRLDAAGQVTASGSTAEGTAPAGAARARADSSAAGSGGAATTITVPNARGVPLELTVFSQP